MPRRRLVPLAVGGAFRFSSPELGTPSNIRNLSTSVLQGLCWICLSLQTTWLFCVDMIRGGYCHVSGVSSDLKPDGRADT